MGDARVELQDAPETSEILSTTHARMAKRVGHAARKAIGPTLPEWMVSFFGATAINQARHTSKVTIRTVCLELAKSARRDGSLNEVVAGFLGFRPSGWRAAEDGLDGHRLQIAARLITAALNDPGAPFELFSRAGLIEALDEAGMQEGRSDAQTSFLAAVRKLATSGSGRYLAPLPTPWQLAELAFDMPNFAKVVDFYQGQAALLQLNGISAALFPPVLLLGPPGVGKTLFAHRLAALVGSPCRVISMANQSAGWILTGLDRSWSSAKPGMVYAALAGMRHANPVLVIDELDKASGDARYSVVGGLYGLLERDTARSFIDEYVCFPINTEAVVWLVTANYVDEIPKPLLSRMSVFEIDSPDEVQSRMIVFKQFERIKGQAQFAPLPSEVVDELAVLAPRDIGVRLRIAVGRAAQRALQARQCQAVVQLEDLPSARKTTVRRLGFL